ncbi:MAG TPA: SRPBCC family protein [Polyangiales bacterium]
MPTTISMMHEFSASAERVFAALDDSANMGSWLGVKIELIKPAASSGLGAVRRLHLGLSTIDEEIFERQAPTHIVYKIVRGLFPLDHHRGEITVTAHGADRAQAVWQIELGSKVPLLESIVGSVLQLAIQRGFVRLDKQLAV